MLEARPAAALSDREYDRLRELIRRMCGIDFSPSRRPDLERAVAEALALFDAPDATALLALLGDPLRGRERFDRWIPHLTIGETHFFRNRPQMQALEREILPDVIERRRASRRLRIWSAGCSTGEEPYTLAMLLDMLLGAERAAWQIHLLATDIDPEHLAHARRGEYGAWSFREVPPPVKSTYFETRGARFQVVEPIRRMVTFGRLNLHEQVYPSALNDTQGLDLIVCRNVLIYFSEDVVRQVAGRFHEALALEGWLVVGHAEPSIELFRQFEPRNFPGAVVYRKPAAPARAQGGAVRTPALELATAPPPPGPLAGTSSTGACATPVGAFPALRPQPLESRSPAPPRRPVAEAVVARPEADPGGARPVGDAAAPSPADEALGLVATGRADEAIALLEQAARDDAADAYAPYALAKIHASRMRWEAAEHWLEVALARSSMLAPAHYLRGLIIQERGDDEGAIEAHRRATYADPEFALAHFALAGLFARVGQPARAVKALDNVTALLAGRERAEALAEGDGLTVGRLLDLATAQRGLVA